MSQTTDAWIQLYDAQTFALGAITATVTGFATNKKAIPTEIGSDDVILAGGVGEKGGLIIQMLASEFATEPPKFTAVSCNGRAGVLLELKNNGGIYYLTVGDAAANE